MAIINGTKSANTLNGTSSRDTIYALEGNDVIRGYGGNDILYGDSVLGDAGSDTFIFESTALANGVDTLMDYKYDATKGAEQDILDLTALFGALGTKTIMSNYAKFQVDGGKVSLYVDKDGTGKSYAFAKIAVFDNFAGGEYVRIKAGTSFFTLGPAPSPESEAVGTLTVTGTAQEGGSLIASLSATDADGTITNIAYQWQEEVSAGSWSNLTGATNATLSIPSDQSYVGKTVRVVATTTDSLGGTTEFQGNGQIILNTEDEATGTLTVSGTAQEGGSLTASLIATDVDGTITSTAYQWQEEVSAGNWSDLSGKTNATLSIPSDQSYVGKTVRVVATTTDSTGGTTVFQGSGQLVANVNDAPTLTAITTLGTGVANEDQFYEITYAALSAAADEADVDLDTLSFKIKAISTGTLEIWNGSAWVTAVVGDVIDSTHKVQWKGAADANGELNAFTVVAYDGALESSTPVQVKVQLTNVPEAPSVTGVTFANATYLSVAFTGDPIATSFSLILVKSAVETILDSDYTNGDPFTPATAGDGVLSIKDNGGNITSTGYHLYTGVNSGTGAADTINASVLTGGVKAAIYGLGGTDTITGSANDDFISGGDGADNITGGGGIDVVYGGAGQDAYNFNSTLSSNRLQIKDFATGGGGDDLRFDISDFSLAGGDEYVGAIGSLTVDSSKEIVILTGAGYASDEAAETALAGRVTTDGQDVILLYFNTSDNTGHIIYDADAGVDGTGTAVLIGQLSNLTTQTAFDALTASSISSVA